MCKSLFIFLIFISITSQNAKAMDENNPPKFVAFKPSKEPEKEGIEKNTSYPSSPLQFDEETGRYYYGKKLSEITIAQSGIIPSIIDDELIIFILPPCNVEPLKPYISLNNSSFIVPEKVISPRDFPWRANGRLIMNYGGVTNYVGSGVLIGEDLVLTAAHNFLPSGRGGIEAKKIRFYPGLNRENVPWEAGVVQVAVHPEWIRTRHTVNPTESADIAVLKLDALLGKKLGYYGIEMVDDQNNITIKEINITGYPCYDVNQNENRDMYNMKNNIKEITKDKIIYKMNTFEGQSGGAIWISNKEDQPICIGVHAYANMSESYGVLINKEKFDKIDKWIKHLSFKVTNTIHCSKL